MKRLLIATHLEPHFGGAGKYACTVARNAVERHGLDVTAVANCGDCFAGRGLDLETVSTHWEDRLVPSAKAIAQALVFLAHCRPSLVFVVHAGNGQMLNLVAGAWLLRLPVIGSHRGMIGPLMPQRRSTRHFGGLVPGIGLWHRKMVLGRRLLARCTTIALFSNRENVELGIQRMGYPRGKCRLIPNGVDTAQFHPDPDLRERTRAELGVSPSQTVIGSIGRFSHDKGQDLLVRAFAGSNQRKLGALLLFVGEGDGLPYCKDLAAELAMGEQVRFLPDQRDVVGLMNALDIFVLPSRMECFSNSMLEAMACAKPVIVSATGGALDAIEPGRNGLLWHPENVDELTEKIDSLMDVRHAAEMGAAGRQTVETAYTTEAVMEQTFQLVCELTR